LSTIFNIIAFKNLSNHYRGKAMNDNIKNKIQYLEIIQGAITRMTWNSFTMKGWAVALLIGLFTLATVDVNQPVYEDQALRNLEQPQSKSKLRLCQRLTLSKIASHKNLRWLIYCLKYPASMSGSAPAAVALWFMK
jgi:hypothetical protein